MPSDRLLSFVWRDRRDRGEDGCRDRMTDKRLRWDFSDHSESSQTRGRVRRSPHPSPSRRPISTDPSKGAKVRLGRPGLPQPGRGFGHPHRRHHRGDRDLPAVACRPGADAQRGELLPLRRQLGHHRHVGDAVRHLRPVAGDGVRVVVRAGAGHAGGTGHRDLPDAVRAAAGGRSAGLHGGPAGSGAVDHLRRVGPVRAGPGDQASCDVAQREPELALPVLHRQRVGGRRRHHLHRGHRARR